MLDEFLLDILLAIFTIIANIFFLISIIRRTELRPYIFSFIALSIGSIFIILKVVDVMYRTIVNIFYFISSILFLIALLREEYQIARFKNQSIKNNAGVRFLFFQAPIYIGLYFFQAFTTIIMVVILIMLIHVYLVKRTLVHISFIILFTLALSAVISTFLDHFNVIGALEFSYGSNFGFVTALLLTSFVAFFEEKLITSEKQLRISEKRYKKAFKQVTLYKDIFTHDIGNVIHSINSSIELANAYIKSSEDRSKIAEVLDIVERSVRRGMRLISNVRKFSEIEEGIKLSLKDVDVHAKLNEAITSVKNIYHQKDITVEIESSEQSIHLRADDLLLDVFKNILNNAVKYNDDNEVKVLIKITKENIEKRNYFKLEFIDYGMGISDSRKEIIFKKGFHELKGGKGMGLGLSLVKEIIKRYDGKIWIEDRIKDDHLKGSKFILLLSE